MRHIMVVDIHTKNIYYLPPLYIQVLPFDSLHLYHKAPRLYFLLTLSLKAVTISTSLTG